MYTKSSPYYLTPKVDFYLGLYADRPIRPDPSDELIEITDMYKYRPYLLSKRLYGTEAYHWVFIRRNMNKIKDPIWDFLPGLQIFVPTKNRLLQLLG